MATNLPAIWTYESIRERRIKQRSEVQNLKTAVTTLASSGDPLSLARAQALIRSRREAEALAKDKANRARRIREAQETRDKASQGGGGGGLFGKALGVAGRVLDPLQDVTNAIEGNIALQFGDVQDGELGFSKGSILQGLTNTGKEIAGAGIWSDAYQKQQEKNLRALGRDPSQSLTGQLKQLSDVGGKEFQQTGRIPAGVKTAGNIAFDPLMYVAPGVAGKIAKSSLVARTPIANKLASAALTGKFNPLGGLLEGPSKAGFVGMLAGAAGGAELADRTNIPFVGDRYEQMVASGLGGILGGGLTAAATRGARGAQVEAPKAGVTEEVPADTRLYHGTQADFEGLPAPSEVGKLGAGVYVSTNPKVASLFAGLGGQDETGGRVIPMRAAGGLRLLVDDARVTDEEVSQIARALGEEGQRFTREFANTAGNGGDALDTLADLAGDLSGPARNKFAAQTLEAAGFDGIALRGIGASAMDEAVVFDPSKLRSEFEPKGLGALPTENYRKDLSEYTPTLYHETSPDEAVFKVGLPNVRSRASAMWYSNSPDLAMGQGGNRGVLIQYDAQGMAGQVNRSKPAWEHQWQSGLAEFYDRSGTGFIGRNAQRVTIKPEVQNTRAGRSLATRLETDGWAKSSAEDGSIVFARPAAATEPKGFDALKPEQRQAIQEDAQAWMQDRTASATTPDDLANLKSEYDTYIGEQVRNAESLNVAETDARNYVSGAQEVNDTFVREVEGFVPGEDYGIGSFRQYEGTIGSLAKEVELGMHKGQQLATDLGFLPERDGLDMLRALQGEATPDPRFLPLYNWLRLNATGEGQVTRKAFESMGIPWNPRIADESYFPRYFRRVELPTAEVENIMRGGGGFAQRRGFQKHRVDATFGDLVDGVFQDEKGFYKLEPLTKDPFQMLALRQLQGIEAREQNALMKRWLDPVIGVAVRVDRKTGIMPEGYRVPRGVRAFEGKPVSFIIAEEDTEGIKAALENFGPDAADAVAQRQRAALTFTDPVAVPEKLADLLEGMYGPGLSLGKVGGVDILKAIQAGGNVAKRAKLFGSLFQQVDFTTRSGFAAFGGAIDALLRGEPAEAVAKLAKFPRQVGDIVRANLSPKFRQQLTEEILSGKALFPERPDLSLRLIAENGWIQHDPSLMARDIRAALQQEIDDALSAGGKASQLKDATRKLKSIDKAMQAGLFDGVYPQSQKFALENFIVPRLMHQHPEFSSKQIAANAAMEVNKMFSTLGNYQTVVKNRAMKTMLHSLIFSTNETESLIRQAGSVFAGPNKQLWGEYYLGGALMLGATANLIHLAATGEMLPWDRYSPIDVGDKPGARYNKLGIGIGYNSNFLQPTLPLLRGRSGSRVDLDLMGQMDTALRLLDPISFFQARENVLPRALVNQALGEDFYGRPIDTVGPRGIVSRAQQAAQDIFQPVGAGMVAEAARQAVPGADKLIPENEGRIGVGGSLIQASGLNLGGEGTAEILDRYAQQTYGMGYKDLEPVQKEELVKANPKLERELEMRRKTAAERQDQSAILGEKVTEIRERQKSADDQFLTGTVRREDWLSARKDRLHEISVLKKDFFSDKQRRNPKTPLDFYFKQIEAATDPTTGEVNWTAVDAWREALPEEDQAYIERNTGIGDTPLGKMLRTMQSEYYSLARYRGYTADESVLIDQLWQEARNIAGSTDKSAMNRALGQVAIGANPKIVRGVRERIYGTLLDLQLRDRWKLRHPESAIFLGSGTLTPRDTAAIERALSRVD